MLKLLTFLVAIGLSGCIQGQRFMLMKNAQLDVCAMKRMSETQISGQNGYLQAHQDCHHLVNAQKGQALHLESIDVATKNGPKDVFEEYKLCWEFVKDRVIDKYYPDLRLPGKRLGNHQRTKLEHYKERVIHNFPLLDKLRDLTKEKLIIVRDTMQSEQAVGHDTLCSPWKYQELSAIVGMEVHRRFPYGVDDDRTTGF